MIEKLVHLHSLFRIVLICSKLHALHGGKCSLDDNASHSIIMKCTDDSSCPTWNYCSSSGICQCGEKHHGVIQCRNDERKISTVLDCNCVTYDEDTGSPLLAQGLLCGECEDGFSPYVLSHNLSCVECPDGHKNWWKLL